MGSFAVLILFLLPAVSHSAGTGCERSPLFYSLANLQMTGRLPLDGIVGLLRKGSRINPHCAESSLLEWVESVAADLINLLRLFLSCLETPIRPFTTFLGH